jgi:hypothetical protein
MTTFRETVATMLNACTSEPNIQTRTQLSAQMFGYIADSAADFYKGENKNEKNEKLMKVMRDKCNELIDDLIMGDKPVPKEMERCKQVLKALLNKWPYSTSVPISENSYKLLNRALNINLEDNCDEYYGTNYRINLDGDIAFVYFSSIDETGGAYGDKTEVANILKTIVNAIGCDPAHALSVYDEETDEQYMLETNEEAEEVKEEDNGVEASQYYATFYFGQESNAFRLLNRALNSSFTNKNTGTYNSPSGYTISLDFDMGYIYFDSIENKEFVKEVIQRIAEIVGDEPNYYITECETGDEIRI